MPNIIVTENSWKRNGTFIKTLIEFIQERRMSETIVNLVEHIKITDYTETERLSDKDIFLLYCKLLDAKRHRVIKTLRLIEDLVEFSDEYSYQTSNSQLTNFDINYPLLAHCILNKVDWKEIAYIQQHRKIKHKNGLKIDTQDFNLSRSISTNITDIQNRFNEHYVKPYTPYLILGDAYVDFINNCDEWSEKIRTTYAKYPEEVIKYLGYMAEHVVRALHSDTETPTDSETQTDTDIDNDTETETQTQTQSETNHDWLRSYSKAFRNMAEEVISSIKNKRSLKQDEKRQEIYDVSRAILDHLDALDHNSLQAIDEKSGKKLKDFIETLRGYTNKISPVAAYSDRQFFASSSSSSANKALSEEVTPSEEASVCSINSK